MHCLLLPYPPSANQLWRSVAGRVLLSAAGRAHRKAVGEAVASQWRGKPLACPLRVTIAAAPPLVRRRRDLSNLLKATEDALTHAGFWLDDSQVQDIHLIWDEPSAKPCLVLTAEAITDE